LPEVRNWVVHIKDVETGHHIIEPVVASKIQVSYEQWSQEISTLRGDVFQVAGPRTGSIRMEFDLFNDNYRMFTALWDNAPQRADIQVNPRDNDQNNGYSRCVLRSMNFDPAPAPDWNDVLVLEWVFMNAEAQINVPRELQSDYVSPWQHAMGRLGRRRRIEPVQKLDWRVSGF